MTDIDPAEVMAEHQPGSEEATDHESYCLNYECEMRDWPCEPYRLAEALLTAQTKVARVAELADRFVLVPRARLVGALTVEPKP